LLTNMLQITVDYKQVFAVFILAGGGGLQSFR